MHVISNKYIQVHIHAVIQLFWDYTLCIFVPYSQRPQILVSCAVFSSSHDGSCPLRSISLFFLKNIEYANIIIDSINSFWSLLHIQHSDSNDCTWFYPWCFHQPCLVALSRFSQRSLVWPTGLNHHRQHLPRALYRRQWTFETDHVNKWIMISVRRYGCKIL